MPLVNTDGKIRGKEYGLICLYNAERLKKTVKNSYFQLVFQFPRHFSKPAFPGQVTHKFSDDFPKFS